MSVCVVIICISLNSAIDHWDISVMQYYSNGVKFEFGLVHLHMTFYWWHEFISTIQMQIHSNNCGRLWLFYDINVTYAYLTGEKKFKMIRWTCVCVFEEGTFHVCVIKSSNADCVPFSFSLRTKCYVWGKKRMEIILDHTGKSLHQIWCDIKAMCAM